MTDKKLLAMCEQHLRALVNREVAGDWAKTVVLLDRCVEELKRRIEQEAIRCDDNFGSQQLLKDIAPQSHMIDIRVRLNGKYYWFEGDFLKQIFPKVNFVQIDNAVKTKLENHEQRRIEQPSEREKNTRNALEFLLGWAWGSHGDKRDAIKQAEKSLAAYEEGEKENGNTA